MKNRAKQAKVVDSKITYLAFFNSIWCTFLDLDRLAEGDIFGFASIIIGGDAFFLHDIIENRVT